MFVAFGEMEVASFVAVDKIWVGSSEWTALELEEVKKEDSVTFRDEVNVVELVRVEDVFICRSDGGLRKEVVYVGVSVMTAAKTA